MNTEVIGAVAAVAALLVGLHRVLGAAWDRDRGRAFGALRQSS